MAEHPPQFEAGDSVSDPEFRRKLNEIAERAFRPIRGPGVTDHPNYVAIQQRRGGGVSQTSNTTPSFWAKITGTAGAIHSHRWVYNWTEMTRTVGTAGWIAGGATGTAMNSIEFANTPGSAVQGNSIDTSDDAFSGTGTCSFRMYEVRGAPIVRMWEETVSDGTNDPKTLYSFEYINQVDKV